MVGTERPSTHSGRLRMSNAYQSGLGVTEAIYPRLARPISHPGHADRPTTSSSPLPLMPSLPFIGYAYAGMSTFRQTDYCKSTFRLLNTAYGRNQFHHLPAIRHPAGADFGTDRTSHCRGRIQARPETARSGSRTVLRRQPR